ncbi:hypothetical protein ACFWN2_07295 [Lentzea sp. NPDC058436]|uniref:hypothetical protein n=1 Tax=Lentzea sp. NPDC058436 TaxID=3346499 RepID=UPI003665F579
MLTASRNQERAARKEAFAQVGAAVAQAWTGEHLTPAAPAVTSRLLDLLPHEDPLVSASVLVALGVLHEAAAPDPATAAATKAAIESDVDKVLGLAATAAGSPPLLLALTYLLAHFRSRRAEIEGLELDLTEDDRARLHRCLTPPADDDAGQYEVGRAWPTPAIWQLTEAERELDVAWRSGLGFSEDDVKVIAGLETAAVLAFLGAQAEFAIWEASDVH